MKNIFILEDTLHVASAANLKLLNAGYQEEEIFHARTLLTADYFINENPGLSSFRFFIVDLSIPDENFDTYFSDDEVKELYNISGNMCTEENACLSGWIWIKRLLRRDKEIARRIVILSAYVNELPEFEKTKYGGKMEFLDKRKVEAINDLYRIIKKK